MYYQILYLYHKQILLNSRLINGNSLELIAQINLAFCDFDSGYQFFLFIPQYEDDMIFGHQLWLLDFDNEVRLFSFCWLKSSTIERFNQKHMDMIHFLENQWYNNFKSGNKYSLWVDITANHQQKTGGIVPNSIEESSVKHNFPVNIFISISDRQGISFALHSSHLSKQIALARFAILKKHDQCLRQQSCRLSFPKGPHRWQDEPFELQRNNRLTNENQYRLAWIQLTHR